MRDRYEEFGFLVVKHNRDINFLYLDIYPNTEMLRKGHYLTSLQFNKDGTELQFIGLTMNYNNIIYVPV